MIVITSNANESYKAILRLKQKKARDQEGLYLIEGPNLIREALDNGAAIHQVVCSRDFKAEALPAHTLFVDDKLFQKLSDTESPQGIFAVVEKRVYSEGEFFQSAEAKTGNFVVLDRLQDPGNIGTLLRTADAAGYQGAILMKGTGDIYSPKVVRAATGSLFRLPVLPIDEPQEAIALLRKYGKKILCTSLQTEADYYHIDMRENIALIIGNEGKGVCKEFMEMSDLQVKIPMIGQVESLNAAVSAGILMYESVRQQEMNK